MKFNFNKKCTNGTCIHKVWDACILNMHCTFHCYCKENKILKTDEREMFLAEMEDRIWRILQYGNRNRRNAR